MLESFTIFCVYIITMCFFELLRRTAVSTNHTRRFIGWSGAIAYVVAYLGQFLPYGDTTWVLILSSAVERTYSRLETQAWSGNTLLVSITIFVVPMFAATVVVLVLTVASWAMKRHRRLGQAVDAPRDIE